MRTDLTRTVAHPKLQALNALASRDALHEGVRALARQLQSAAEAHGDPERCYVLLVAALVRDAVRFQSDTKRVGHEDIAGMTRPQENPLAVLWRGVDDCDAKPRLCVALCRAAGIVARMVGGLDPEGALAHAWVEIHLDNRWQPLETTLSRARVGEHYSRVPKEIGGQWLYT